MVWEDYTRRKVCLIVTLGIQEGKPNSCAVRKARIDKYKRSAGIRIQLFIKKSHLGVYGCAVQCKRNMWRCRTQIPCAYREVERKN